MKHVLALSGGKDSMACLFLMKDQLDCAIYVDTGYAYPETQAVIELAATYLPVLRLHVDREANHRLEGFPSDVVPVEWTPIGQAVTHAKPYRIQSSLQCCLDNIAKPIIAKAQELGATHLVCGLRLEETYKATSRHGDVVEGLVRVHPVEAWTAQQVLDYLATQMDVPAHFFLNHSSLDCYDCTAFHHASQDRLAWTKDRYPHYYAAYAHKHNAILAAVEASL
jgi:phosphoadenosine phosphosulfate reductase